MYPRCPLLIEFFLAKFSKRGAVDNLTWHCLYQSNNTTVMNHSCSYEPESAICTPCKTEVLTKRTIISVSCSNNVKNQLKNIFGLKFPKS